LWITWFCGFSLVDYFKKRATIGRSEQRSKNAGLFMNNRFLLIALLFAGLSFSGFVQAQASTAAPLPSPLQPPVLTPAQQARINAIDLCVAQYRQQNIPRSQFHSFMDPCMRAQGILPALPPTPAGP